MRQFISIFLAILYQIGVSVGMASAPISMQDIGIPSSESYSEEQLRSRVPWDMVIIDDKLYLGGGDFGDNTGPVDVWCQDLATGEWSVSGTLNDEAIGKFKVIGNRVYAPGFDSKGGTWDYGNYHYLENGAWHTNNQLPDAVHNFDIAEYDSKLFFAIGTGNGTDSPVKASSDNGETFIDVSFFKNDDNILEVNQYDYTRVYDFFEINDNLYCMFLGVQGGKTVAYEFYKYETDAFHFVSTGNHINLRLKVLKQEPVSAKVTFQGKCYIAASYLNRTSDFQSNEQLVLPRNEIATDLLVDGEHLYVLCAEATEAGYIVRIYVYVYNSFFYPVASFESQNLPVSFAKQDNKFYVGLNLQGSNETMAGSIYKVTVPEQTLQLVKDCL